jgi:TP901 family phage tail tape measure protein
MMSDTTARTKILLEVGAGVDEAAFNKVVDLIKKKSKSIAGDLKDLQTVSDGSMKKLQGVFGKDIDVKGLEILKRSLKDLLDGIQEGKTAPKKLFSTFIEGLKDTNRFLEVTAKKATEVKKTLAEVYKQEGDIYKKSIGKAATFYDKSVAKGVEKGGLTYSAAERQLAGFVQNLTYTGSKLRSFDAVKYEEWEKKIDFDKISRAVNAGIIRYTKDGFKATGSNIPEAMKVLNVQKAQQTDFLRFSGVSDGKAAASAYKAAKANIDIETQKFSADLAASFKKAFHGVRSHYGVEKFQDWYPSLQKAAGYMQRLPATNLSAEAKQQIGGSNLTQFSKALTAGDLKIVSGELRILTENGLKAMKMTEEFAIKNGLLKKSFVEQNLIKEVAEGFGYSERTIKKALNSVKKDVEESAKATGSYYKDLIANVNLYEAVVAKLTNKKVIADPFRESSAGFQKGMADLKAKYSSDTVAYKDHAAALQKVEAIINKTAERMNAMGQNGDKFRQDADRFAMAQDLVKQKLNVTNNVLDSTAKQWKAFTKTQTESQKIVENISQKTGFSSAITRRITKEVTAAENQKTDAILRANAALVKYGVTEERRSQIIGKIVNSLNVQAMAEKKLLDFQTKSVATAAKKVEVNPFAGSSLGMQKGYASFQAAMSNPNRNNGPALPGSYDYKTWLNELKKADRVIENTASKMNALGKNGDAFRETANRMAIAQAINNDQSLKANGTLSLVNQRYKELTTSQDKYAKSALGMQEAVKQVAEKFGRAGYEHDKWMKAIKGADIIIEKTAAKMKAIGRDGDAYAASMNRLAYAEKLRAGEIKLTHGVEREVYEQWKKSTTAVGRFSAALTDLWGKFKTLASYSLAGSFIYGIQNVLRSAVNVVLEFDQALYNLKAITGATDFEMERFGKKILDLASNTRFSVKEIADSMVVLGQAGFDAQETVQAMDAITALSAATMSDLKSNVDLVTTAIGAFDMQSSDASKVSDIFAAAMNKSKLDLEKLKVAFNYVGPVAHNAGISLEETASMMSLLSNAGIRASTIGTSLRQIIDKLVNPTEEFASAVSAAGYTMDDFNPQGNKMADIIDRLREVVPDAETALKYFGVRGASSISVLTTATKDQFQEMTNAMSESGSVYRMQAIQMEGALSKTKNFVDNMEVLAVKIAGIGLVDAFKLITDAATGFLKTMNSFSEDYPIIAAFAKIAVYVAGAGMAITAVSVLLKGQFLAALTSSGTLLGALIVDLKAATVATFSFSGAAGAATGAVGLLKAAFLALSGVIRANPIGAAITALTILGTAAYAASEHFGFFDNELEKSTKVLDSHRKKVEENIARHEEEKKKIDALTSIVKDNTESLESRKTAVMLLIEAGVKFDSSTFKNITSVKEFDDTLRESIGVLEDYRLKKEDALKGVKADAAVAGFSQYMQSEETLKKKGAIYDKYGRRTGEAYDWSEGLFGERITGETLNKISEEGKKGKSQFDNFLNEFARSQETLKMIEEYTDLVTKDPSKIGEVNDKIREAFIASLSGAMITPEVLEGIKREVSTRQFVTKESAVKKMSSEVVETRNQIDSLVKEFSRKGVADQKQATDTLTKVFTTYTGTITAIKEKTRKEIELVNAGFSEDRDKEIAEIQKREQQAIDDLDKHTEEETRKLLNKYKEIRELKEREEEVNTKTEINVLRERMVKASSEEKKGLAEQIREKEKYLARSKSIIAEEMLAVLNSNDVVREAVKNTAFYRELNLDVKESKLGESKADLDYSKAENKIEKEIAAEKKLAEARRSREAAEIRAEARLAVKNRDYQLSIELADIEKRYAGDSLRIEKEREIATKNHFNAVVAIRQDAFNKISALGADTKKAEWDLLDAKMDDEFLKETSKNAKSAVKRLKDTLEQDFEILSGKEEEELHKLEMANIGNLENIEFQKYEIQKRFLDLKMESLRRYIELLEKAQTLDSSISTTDAVTSLIAAENDRNKITNAEQAKRAELGEEGKRELLEEGQKTKLAGMRQAGQYTELEELEFDHGQEIEALTRKYTILGQITEEGEKVIAEVRKRHAIETANAMQQYYAHQYQQQSELYGGLSDLMGEFYEATGQKMKAFFIFQRAMKVAEIIMNTMAQAAAAGSQTGIFGIPMQAMIMAQGMARAGIVAGQSVAELTMAEGGKVPGYSPTPTADNIDAKLTAGEFVHPVPTVRFYGDEAMEAIRSMAVPRDVLTAYNRKNVKTSSSHFGEGGKVDSSSSGDVSKQETLNIVNILDPAMFDQYMSSHAGQKTLANFISRNPAIIKNALR